MDLNEALKALGLDSSEIGKRKVVQGQTKIDRLTPKQWAKKKAARKLADSMRRRSRNHHKVLANRHRRASIRAKSRRAQ